MGATEEALALLIELGNEALRRSEPERLLDQLGCLGTINAVEADEENRLVVVVRGRASPPLSDRAYVRTGSLSVTVTSGAIVRRSRGEDTGRVVFTCVV